MNSVNADRAANFAAGGDKWTESRPSAAAEFSHRIAGLSPEKQALLARRFAERSARNGESDRIEPRNGDGPAPLSKAQEMLWVYEQMNPGTDAYHIPMARRVRGRLDAAILEQALLSVVERHEALRTKFVELEGEPKQVIVDAPHVQIERHDLRAWPSEPREAEGARLLREATARPIDLAAGTFPRVVLVQMADDEALLLVVVHHIVFDGASVSILFRDLAQAYEMARKERPAKLPPLPIQFADFTTWSTRTYDAARMQPALKYWRDALKGIPAGVDLPTDLPRLSQPKAAGARFATTLSGSTLDAVRGLAAANGATPFMVLIAGFQTLLHRYSGQEDIGVGTPIAGRTLVQTQDLIGYFANTLVLRASFEGAPTFRALLGQVRTGTVRAYEHQVVPYEQLVYELRAGQAATEQSLFNVMFTFQDTTTATPRIGDAVLEPLGVELGAAKFELTVSAAEVPGGLRIAVEYRSDLFEHETVARFVNHFESLLLAAAQAPDTPVSQLPLLTDSDRRELARWNATDVAYPELEAGDTLVTLLEAVAASRPTAIAVRVDDSAQPALTYGALHARADKLAQRLRTMGIGVGDRVAVSVERSSELVIALLGVLKSGAAYVPVDPEYPAARVAYMLGDADARVLLTHHRTHDVVSPLAKDLRVLSLDDLDGWPETPSTNAAAFEADAPAYMIYTSGSTGQPKGAVNAHRGIVNRLVWMQAQYRLSDADIVLQKTPFSFDVSVWEFFWPLITGATLAIARPGGHRDPSYLADVIERLGITTLHFVPSMLQAFIETVPADILGRLHSLRHVMCSGEALPAEVVRRAFARLPQTTAIHNLYGPTECAVDVTHWTCKRDDARATVPIGHPVANTKCYVLDALGQEQPVGIPGELFVGGVQVGLGYHGRPELTAEKFVRHPTLGRLYRTGDITRRLPDGAIDFIGRADFQVKLRGFRIELGEIENALVAQSGLAAATVVMRADVPGLAGEMALVAYVVPVAGATVDVTALRAHLRTILPDHMVPTAFQTLDVLPLSPNGKIDRKALPKVVEVVSEPSTRPAVALRTELEMAIASVWSEVLGREINDVESSFFDLGGHSLIATRIVARLTKIFRTTLTLRRFFDTPTIAGVAAALIEGEAKAGQTATIASLYRKAQQISAEQSEQLRRDKPSIAQCTGQG